ncbi:hypothetical protein LguiA_003712 [Lonicera macranthoides]
MADQRPAFRFRLPWLLPSAPAPAPAPAPARPTVAIQTPAQPTTTTPIGRPPFRPAGVAPPPPPPPQVQAPPRTESQPSSPSRVGTQSRVSSQPASPARVAAQAQAASQLPPPPAPSPQVQAPPRTESQPSAPSRVGAQILVSSQPASSARVGTQTRAASPTLAAPQPQAQSPTRAVPQSRAASQPWSPSRTTPPPQPTFQTASQPGSPSRLGTQPPPATSSLPSSPSITKLQPRTEPVAQARSPPKSVQTTTRITTEPTPPISEKDAKPVLSQLPPISAEPPLPEKEPTKPIVPQPEIPEAQPKKQDSSTNDANLKPLTKSDGKPEETKDEEVQKTTVEPERKTVIELLTEASSHLKAKTKWHPTVASQDQEKQLESQEILETTEKAPISRSSEKQPKPMISDPKEKCLVSESRQTPAISNGQRVPLHKEIRDDISKFVNKMTIGHTKHNMEEKPVSVITIAGENRGAFMHLGSNSSSKRERSVHIHRGYKLNPDESTEATTDGEESSKGKRKPEEADTTDEEAKKSYINSNTQGINNSIVLDGSITERNPGVNAVFSHNIKEPINSNHRTESLSRAEINITPSQKLTYEPTVRRRCLRGLFLEPSDSDTDNPEKPRRHGCLYACGAKSNNDNNIDVL